MTVPAIRAVLLDLDDTIYPQADYLAGAWDAVVAAGESFGVPPELLRHRLAAIAAEGSDQGRIIDRALASLTGHGLHVEGVPVKELVAAFTSFQPARLDPYPGVPRALAALRALVPIAVISDGNVNGQRFKLEALGLTDAFDVVVLSDEIGRSYRKPSPVPFQRALAALSVPAAAAVMIGDRPDKDVSGAAAAGIRAVRIRTGEYANRPDSPCPWAVAADLPSAVALLLPMCGRVTA